MDTDKHGCGVGVPRRSFLAALIAAPLAAVMAKPAAGVAGNWQVGCVAPGSVMQMEQRTFFIHPSFVEEMAKAKLAFARDMEVAWLGGDWRSDA